MKQARNDSNWMIILLTDGDFGISNTFNNLIESIKLNGLIFAVVVVGAESERIKQIPSSKSLYFQVKTFDYLND